MTVYLGAGPLAVLTLVPRGVPVTVVAADLVDAEPLFETPVTFLKLGPCMRLRPHCEDGPAPDGSVPTGE